MMKRKDKQQQYKSQGISVAMIILDIHVASVIRMLFLPTPLDLMNYGVVIQEWQASLSSYVFMPGKDCVSLAYIGSLFISFTPWCAYDLSGCSHGLIQTPGTICYCQLLRGEREGTLQPKNISIQTLKSVISNDFQQRPPPFSPSVAWGILLGLCLSHQTHCS